MRAISRLCMVLVAMVGCASHHDAPGPAPAPDAPPVATGPFTVNVTKNAQGIVVSEPAGIRCGSCANDPHITCPLPDPTQPATECSHAFDTGTSVTLTITAQELYAGAFCMFSTPAAPGAGSNGPCTFMVTQDMDVNITGVEAFQ